MQLCTMNLEKGIGSAIKTLRTEQEKSQEELAKDSCLSRTYIGSIERGEKQISVRYLLYITKALGMSLVEFLQFVNCEGISDYQKPKSLLHQEENSTYTNPVNIIEQSPQVEVSPSVFLYYSGDKSLIQHPKRVAIIGKKNPTEFGIKSCENITKWFLQKGYVIISGMEKGIDTVVQKTCLKYSGKSIVVISSGLRNIFPKENRGLAEEIIKSGGLLLSKYPDNSSSRPPYYLDSRKIQVNLGINVLIVESQLNDNEMKAGLFTLKQKGKLAIVDTPEKYWNRAKGNIILKREHSDKVFVLLDENTPIESE